MRARIYSTAVSRLYLLRECFWSDYFLFLSWAENPIERMRVSFRGTSPPGAVFDAFGGATAFRKAAGQLLYSRHKVSVQDRRLGDTAALSAWSSSRVFVFPCTTSLWPGTCLGSSPYAAMTSPPLSPTRYCWVKFCDRGHNGPATRVPYNPMDLF